MSNRRDLKKEINESVNEFAGVCLNYIERHTGENALAVDQLIDEAADMLDDLMNRINNHTHLDEGKATKAYFQGIEDEFNSKLEALYEKYQKATA